ncbi:P-TEFb-associated cyclin-dependent protein kinase Cdk9 [Schizosaccharomyces osmophilus]|uniref:p-TEFb-associated cyclin-dependent protein kinase Cdk9 n=1 Tax=Schizosaccharomyces osmophilus TaxID=2545709 RepID=A0AAF0AVY8_9SCHI|nr:P-TEFb-associated cyclin-dependent protein kinase Cdk9 [Schizosaccharomyces osmophilus]WBW72977.1 P-TEFb-associated cyclin-dependent protein kinase Cdk9 [Schizosaccharomyces osmophilus]
MKRSGGVMSENEKVSRRKVNSEFQKRFQGCSHLFSYELMEKLGEGTFGEVYKSKNKASGKLYALKKILLHTEREGFPITAIREIKILKSLSHENVIALTDMTVVRADKKHRKRGSIYMVTPYMDHDLSGLLKNPSVKFTEPQIKCYMKQLLAGTKYLHDSFILHRDLKAANLLIDNHGFLKIADFGLARVIDEESYANKNPGIPPPNRREYTGCVVTRWYRSPELLLNERRYTTAIDMWSVGCIMAEMYRGKPIMQGSSDLDQLDRIFRLCGSPTQASMPNWEKLPGCEGVRSFPAHPRTLETAFFSYGKVMTSLFGSILRLDPDERLSAGMALDHEYFTTEPLPADPSQLQHYTSSHEYDKRKDRDVHNANGNPYNKKRSFRFVTRGPGDPWYGMRRPNPQYRSGNRRDNEGGGQQYHQYSRRYQNQNISNRSESYQRPRDYPPPSGIEHERHYRPEPRNRPSRSDSYNSRTSVEPPAKRSNTDQQPIWQRQQNNTKFSEPQPPVSNRDDANRSSSSLRNTSGSEEYAKRNAPSPSPG